jgi:hypothetical protein
MLQSLRIHNPTLLKEVSLDFEAGFRGAKIPPATMARLRFSGCSRS